MAGDQRRWSDVEPPRDLGRVHADAGSRRDEGAAVDDYAKSCAFRPTVETQLDMGRAPEVVGECWSTGYTQVCGPDQAGCSADNRRASRAICPVRAVTNGAVWASSAPSM